MNITSLDILYIALAVGFISLVVFLNLILYNVWQMVRSARTSIDNVHSVTKSVLNTKARLKLTALNALKSVISRLNN